MNSKTKKPEWAPEGDSTGFACRVMDGVEAGHDGISSYRPAAAVNKAQFVQRPSFTVDDYAQGVLSGSRAMLGRAITLVESNAARHIDQAQEVLQLLLPHTGKSIRVGITGVPGVGKSSFIEAFGCYLVEQGHRVAVLAVDPSSSISGGSILGDKTRMERLSREERCFIRPSPAGKTLGGVARKTRETMLVCEAAGFDVILIETVGVGQSETAVRSMVDFFLLLMLSGAGDELQGIKKGIMELADALVITKADGSNKIPAQTARSEYERAMHYLQPSTEGWVSHAFTCSSMTGEGIAEIWRVIEKFQEITSASGVFEQHRRDQNVKWVHEMIDAHLHDRFVRHAGVRQIIGSVERAVADGVLPAVAAMHRLLEAFEEKTL
ncbi:MAG: methylmalonyl Co-A mutase-associated GTPase MeaB [Desulfobulbaceae bacterium]|nr:methylmalonyl Co-A mutase-associated GTPase MeaB [Desulfobulbaceae bacterium]